MAASEVFATGFHFAECPRWHDGALWLSDMDGRRVERVDAGGSRHLVHAFDEGMVVRLAIPRLAQLGRGGDPSPRQGKGDCEPPAGSATRVAYRVTREAYQAAREAYFSVGKLTKSPERLPWRPEKLTEPRGKLIFRPGSLLSHEGSLGPVTE